MSDTYNVLGGLRRDVFDRSESYYDFRKDIYKNTPEINYVTNESHPLFKILKIFQLNIFNISKVNEV